MPAPVSKMNCPSTPSMVALTRICPDDISSKGISVELLICEKRIEGMSKNERSRVFATFIFALKIEDYVVGDRDKTLFTPERSPEIVLCLLFCIRRYRV